MADGEDPVVAVIGTNPRGAALARALAAAGKNVMVWDAAGPETGAPQGTSWAGSARAAVATASVVLLCVDDYGAVRRVLGQAAPYVAARDVVNVTSGTSAEAEEVAAWTPPCRNSSVPSPPVASTQVTAGTVSPA
ncbi:hypothetical protein GCM10022224_023590 [Nonomuraea antimicrobica]|uniref:6-phosphogluconate dehydrogenase NADP-binding domain-containing protein n=1 Tax=Nonomuraea antimicrobica TaxID=561173 RepID=A0ABP7BFN5_9ACTN